MTIKYDPDKHHRRSIRLKGCDYSQSGTYFVTICTQYRKCLFGEIVNGQMILNDAGKMIQAIWNKIPEHYPGIEIDQFAVMPNHIHGIIIIVGAGPRACPDTRACPDMGQPRGVGQPQGVAPTGLSLFDVVHRLKSFTTAQYRHGAKQNDWPPFPGKLWQRNYYEHIVRDENELNCIREYIINNPLRWEFDKENPDGKPDETERKFWEDFT